MPRSSEAAFPRGLVGLIEPGENRLASPSVYSKGSVDTRARRRYFDDNVLNADVRRQEMMNTLLPKSSSVERAAQSSISPSKPNHSPLYEQYVGAASAKWAAIQQELETGSAEATLLAIKDLIKNTVRAAYATASAAAPSPPEGDAASSNLLPPPLVEFIAQPLPPSIRRRIVRAAAACKDSQPSASSSTPRSRCDLHTLAPLGLHAVWVGNSIYLSERLASPPSAAVPSAPETPPPVSLFEEVVMCVATVAVAFALASAESAERKRIADSFFTTTETMVEEWCLSHRLEGPIQGDWGGGVDDVENSVQGEAHAAEVLGERREGGWYGGGSQAHSSRLSGGRYTPPGGRSFSSMGHSASQSGGGRVRGGGRGRGGVLRSGGVVSAVDGRARARDVVRGAPWNAAVGGVGSGGVGGGRESRSRVSGSEPSPEWLAEREAGFEVPRLGGVGGVMSRRTGKRAASLGAVEEPRAPFPTRPAHPGMHGAHGASASPPRRADPVLMRGYPSASPVQNRHAGGLCCGGGGRDSLSSPRGPSAGGADSLPGWLQGVPPPASDGDVGGDSLEGAVDTTGGLRQRWSDGADGELRDTHPDGGGGAHGTLSPPYTPSLPAASVIRDRTPPRWGSPPSSRAPASASGGGGRGGQSALRRETPRHGSRSAALHTQSRRLAARRAAFARAKARSEEAEREMRSILKGAAPLGPFPSHTAVAGGATPSIGGGGAVGGRDGDFRCGGDVDEPATVPGDGFVTSQRREGGGGGPRGSGVALQASVIQRYPTPPHPRSPPSGEEGGLPPTGWGGASIEPHRTSPREDREDLHCARRHPLREGVVDAGGHAGGAGRSPSPAGGGRSPSASQRRCSVAVASHSPPPPSVSTRHLAVGGERGEGVELGHDQHGRSVSGGRAGGRLSSTAAHPSPSAPATASHALPRSRPHVPRLHFEGRAHIDAPPAAAADGRAMSGREGADVGVPRDARAIGGAGGVGKRPGGDRSSLGAEHAAAIAAATASAPPTASWTPRGEPSLTSSSRFGTRAGTLASAEALIDQLLNTQLTFCRVSDFCPSEEREGGNLCGIVKRRNPNEWR